MTRTIWMAALLGGALSTAAAAQSGGREDDGVENRPERETQVQRQRGWTTGQRSVSGEPASRTGNSGPPSPGIEAGRADGLAGGRTDRGPKGSTGIGDTHEDGSGLRKRANEANQRRGKARRDLTKPAQIPADRARSETAGTERRASTNDREPLKEEGQRIPDDSGRKRHSDIAAKTEQPGGSRPDGPTGHDDSPNRGEGPGPTPKEQ